ncbi:hypothetical protein M918_21985 [Clostridium sp. BL8]|nr:hypothetical protein M918_21985 [Clostridium sp. BL8]
MIPNSIMKYLTKMIVLQNYVFFDSYPTGTYNNCSRIIGNPMDE